jgi:hypothetical protein
MGPYSSSVKINSFFFNNLSFKMTKIELLSDELPIDILVFGFVAGMERIDVDFFRVVAHEDFCHCKPIRQIAELIRGLE